MIRSRTTRAAKLGTWDPALAASTGNAPPSEPNWIKAWADKRVNLLGPQAKKKALRWHDPTPCVPESLHLVVRATRYGSTDKQSGEFSKAAFELLHRRYSTGDWAKKTKYWYGSER